MTTGNNKGKGRIYLIIAVLIVVIAGGAYGYRVNKINQMRAEAVASIEAFDVSKYDGKELKTLEKYIADSEAKLEASKDPEEFDSIVKAFNDDAAKLKTTAQKEAERKAKEEAERKAREKAEAEAAAAAAAAAAAQASRSGDSGGCVGGGKSMFY